MTNQILKIPVEWKLQLDFLELPLDKIVDNLPINESKLIK